MNGNPHWTLEMEAAIVTARARDEDWLATFGVDRVFKAGTPGLPWLVKEYLERENPALEAGRREIARLEWNLEWARRVVIGVVAVWVFTLGLLVKEWWG